MTQSNHLLPGASYSMDKQQQHLSALPRLAVRWRRQSRPLRWFICLFSVFAVGWALLLTWRWTQLTRSTANDGHLQSPDLLASAHCTQPHPGRPLLQYVLMMDAGSTGSRIHVYRFNYCKAQPELESEVFEHIKPGLSAFPDDPIAAARSLDPLLKVALDSVPVSLHRCTPIAVKATAGLRLLGTEKSDAILQKVREHLKADYPFPLVKKDGVAIMDGKDEGVYAWITVNYLLGKLGAEVRAPSAAIFDLGGGSTQIVFEPSMPIGQMMAEGEHAYAMQFSGEHYNLYQHSYLGYGLMEARRRIKQHVVTAHLHSATSNSEALTVAHPCLPHGHRESIDLAASLPDAARDAPQAHLHDPQLHGTGRGLEECREVVKAHLFDKSYACPLRPCAFDGVYQPSLQHTFDHGDIFVFSYFYDRLSPLGYGRDFTLQDVRDAAEHVCRGDAGWFERERGAHDVAQRLAKSPNFCLDMTFIYSLLHDGYEIPHERRIHMAKKLQGYETGWCVGAAIAVLDEGHLCEVHEVA